MLKDMQQPKIVILGMGNLLLQDEGIGIHFVQMLSKDELDYTNVEIIDGGTSPEIASLVEDADKLIIVDAVKGGKEPGTIYRFSADEIELDSPMKISLHYMGVLDNLMMLKLLRQKPLNTIIIGVEPETIDWGLELSPRIKKRLEELKRIVIQEIRDEMA